MGLERLPARASEERTGNAQWPGRGQTGWGTEVLERLLRCRYTPINHAAGAACESAWSTQAKSTRHFITE